MLKATIIGNLGNDPDMRYSANGQPFLRFNVASNYRTRTPEGEWQDRVEWVQVTVFGQRAETLSQYLNKGMRVYCEGRLEARPWTDQQQNIRAGLQLMASDVEFMTSRADDEERRADGGNGYQQQRQSAPQQQRPAATATRPAATQATLDDGDLEDLPF